MMNDRFSAQLRQHLVDSANERPADGQIATVIDRVAVTPQRHPVTARLAWAPGRVGPFPSTVLRYGLVAATLVALSVAAAIMGGGALQQPRSTVFEGAWTAIDSIDRSTMTLSVGPGPSPTVRYVDELATGGACDQDRVKRFTADGRGQISGSRLVVEYPDGGGCGSRTVHVAMVFDYQAARDVLLDQGGIVWTRVAGVPVDPATPAPSSTEPAPQETEPQPTEPQPEPTIACVDLSNGGTYRGSVGPLAVSLTLPDAPLISWRGEAAGFYLADGCDGRTSITIMPSTRAADLASSCLPETGPITTFDAAVAKLDAWTGGGVAERVDLSIDGHRAARYDITSLGGCLGGFGIWGGTSFGVGETGSLFLIDVDGELVAVELNRDGTQTPAQVEEAWAVVASLQFE